MVKRFFSQAWLYHKARTAAFDWREFLFFDTGYDSLLNPRNSIKSVTFFKRNSLSAVPQLYQVSNG